MKTHISAEQQIRLCDLHVHVCGAAGKIKEEPNKTIRVINR